MLCGAIDIGSNTTRLLVAEPQEGQLRKVMEQRAYTRIGKGASKNGKITAEKIAEVAEVVTRQVRLAHEMGAEVIKTVATAAIREAKNRDKVVKEIEEAAGVEVFVLDEEEEGPPGVHRRHQVARPPGGGQDRRGRRRWRILGDRLRDVLAEGVTEVKSFKIGSACPPRTTWNRTRRRRRDPRPPRPHLGFLRGRGVRAARPSGGGRRERDLARTLVGSVLEYETPERAVRVLDDEIYEVAKRFELDSPGEAAPGRRPAAREVQ